MKYFTIEKDKDKTYLVDNTRCDIEGKPFKYEVDKYDAKELADMMNQLFSEHISLAEILNIVHNIKYGKWDWNDLHDYIYKGISMDELWCRYDSIHKVIIEAKNKRGI